MHAQRNFSPLQNICNSYSSRAAQKKLHQEFKLFDLQNDRDTLIEQSSQYTLIKQSP